METGTIPLASLSGGFDLSLTLESGQSYLWRRADGEMYEPEPAPGVWYHTVADGDVVRVREREPCLEWEATTDADAMLRRRLRLDDDLAALCADLPDDPLLADAFRAHRGLRLVRDPPFATLISFICSQQMRVGRIHDMVTTLTREYGQAHALDGDTYHAFPEPAALAGATESDLRDLGLGYRAPYVVRTAEMVADGEAHPADARELPYDQAREYLTQFVGVGDKVADCVLLFALGFDEAIPLDTWMQTAISDHYPDCDRGSYADTARALREQFGGEKAGYVQTYLFHHLRTNDPVPTAD
jgi:N-glycosylase/DNA lyase